MLNTLMRMLQAVVHSNGETVAAALHALHVGVAYIALDDGP